MGLKGANWPSYRNFFSRTELVPEYFFCVCLVNQLMQSCPVTSHRGKFSTLNRPITNQYFFSHRRHLVLANNNPCKRRVFIIFRSNSKAIYVTLSAYVYRTADWSVLNGERNVFLVRKGKYSVVVLAAVAPWGFYLNIIIRE